MNSGFDFSGWCFDRKTAPFTKGVKGAAPDKRLAKPGTWHLDLDGLRLRNLKSFPFAQFFSVELLLLMLMLKNGDRNP